MQKEKKNEIWISRNGLGYFVCLTDNHYINRHQNNRIENYTYGNFNGGLAGGDYYDLLNKLLEFGELYSKGIKLKFENIPEKEKLTIEKLVKRLEKLSTENKDLKYSLKMICELSKNKEEKPFFKYKRVSQA